MFSCPSVPVNHMLVILQNTLLFQGSVFGSVAKKINLLSFSFQLKHVFTGKFVHMSTTQTSQKDKNNMKVSGFSEAEYLTYALPVLRNKNWLRRSHISQMFTSLLTSFYSVILQKSKCTHVSRINTDVVLPNIMH